MKSGESQERIDKIKTIQVNLLAGLTEVVLALPALRALRLHYPEARLGVVTSPAGKELLLTVPWIDEVIEIGRWRKGEILALISGYRTIRSIGRMRQMVRNGLVPDLQIDLNGRIGASLLRLLSGYSIGSSLTASTGRSSRGTGQSESFLKMNAHLHRSHYYLRRLESLGVRPVIAAPELSTNLEADRRIEKLLHRLHIESGRLLIGLHPGTGLGVGEDGWPIERFIRLGQRLINQFDARLLILAGPGEELRRRQLGAALPARAAIQIERLPLVDYLSLTARLTLLIGNAGAVPHLGAAVGTPVVAISRSSAPTPYELTNERAMTIRAPHFDQPDLENEEAVFEAACQLMSLNRSGLLRDRQ